MQYFFFFFAYKLAPTELKTRVRLVFHGYAAIYSARDSPVGTWAHNYVRYRDSNRLAPATLLLLLLLLLLRLRHDRSLLRDPPEFSGDFDPSVAATWR